MAPNLQTFRRLRLDGVSRAFGTLNALKDLTLDIERGEFIALLGPSGCGKSTALNCIAGLLPTTGGSIWLDDHRIDTLGPEDRGFGMVFQNYALFPHMSVRNNVAFGLKMRGVAKAEAARRADEALATVRLTNQADKLPGQLSGGQQQRVAIARAIVVEPPLVLMDEPLSNLDAKLRLEMRAEIRRIHSGLGSITIYVTHDHEEALSLADRIVVLRDGMIRQVGTPEQLYARPDHVDVADFMGFRNRFNVKVLSENAGKARIAVGGAEFTAHVREPISGGAGIAAVRPDDLMATPADGTGIPATITAIEYRGHDFFGSAQGPGGIELFVRARTRLNVGDSVSLKPDEDKMLLFAGAM